MSAKHHKRHTHFRRHVVTSLAKEHVVPVRNAINRATRKNDYLRHRGMLNSRRNQRRS